MMKSYALLGGAFLFGLSAMAAPKAESIAAQFVSVADEMAVSEAVMTSSTVKKAPMKVSSTADLEGLYNCEWLQWRLNGNDPYAGKCTPYILPGDAPTEIYINGLPNGAFDPILATVDFEKATVTIKSGQQIYSTPDNGPLIVKTAMPVENPEDGKMYWTDMAECVGNIMADGTLDFSNCSLMGNWVNLGNSYNFGFGNFKMTKAAYFTFNASEWEVQSDKASYIDGWLAPLLDGYPSSYPAAQQLTYYVSKANKNLFAFANPYAGTYWDPLNEVPAGKTKDGFIVVDATEVDCALVKTLTASGLWMVMEENKDAEMFYLFNQEGYKAFQQGVPAEDQVDEYLGIGADPNKYLSYYKPVDGLIKLMNLQFGYGIKPTSQYTWSAAKDNPPTTTITIAKRQNGGVDGIEIEAAEGPAKYFNMQGIEVVNPAKGQLVIKKQGNKVEKVVM